MKKNILLHILSTIIILSSCSKKSDSDNNAPDKEVDIILAGTFPASGLNRTPIYLKDGTIHIIAESSSTVYNAIWDFAYANNTAISTGGVSTTGSPRTGNYWINNTKQSLAPALAWGENIFINGTDLYISGRDDADFKSKGMVWKNGNSIHSLSSSGNVQTKDIKVVGNDIYVAGIETNTTTFANTARFWKNGISQSLTLPSEQTEGYGIAISGSDIYVCGSIRKTGPTRKEAVYWKNGTMVTLSSASSNNIWAKKIEVVNNVVHIIGSEDTPSLIESAKYWKDGTEVNLLKATETGRLFDMVVHDNNVYILGLVTEAGGNKSVVWKNGERFKEFTNSYDREATFNFLSVIDKN